MTEPMFDFEQLLRIAHSTNAPAEMEDGHHDFPADDGWKVTICYEDGKLSHVYMFYDPEGQEVPYWEMVSNDELSGRDLLMDWRGPADTERTLAAWRKRVAERQAAPVPAEADTAEIDGEWSDVTDPDKDDELAGEDYVRQFVREEPRKPHTDNDIAEALGLPPGFFRIQEEKEKNRKKSLYLAFSMGGNVALLAVVVGMLLR